MDDPRINPNYRGVKCPGCGEYLPSLITDLCSYCQHKKDAAEIERLTAEVSQLRTVYEAAKKEVDAFDGGYGVTVKHLRKAVAAVSGSPKCPYWAMVDKGRTNYPYEEHWRDCDICQKRDPECTVTRQQVQDDA